MASPDLSQEFDTALTPQIYRGAWGFCVRLCPTREDAEDLLQDSLTLAYRKFGQLREPARFKPWLFAIIRSRFISQRRRRQLPAEDVYWQQQISAGSPEHPLTDVLGEALNRLPREQSELLGLFYLEGMNLEETGLVLGIPPRAVAQRLHRARNTLRRKLGDFPELGYLSQG